MRTPFDAAVARHGPTVLRVCRAALGAGPDADDAWSETFLSALRAWPDLPEETNVEAWLVRVAHRRAVDVVRRGTRAGDPAGGADDVAALEALDARNGVGRSSAGGHAGGHDDDPAATRSGPPSRRCPPGSGSAWHTATWAGSPMRTSPS